MESNECYRAICQHMHKDKDCPECACTVFVDPSQMPENLRRGLATICVNCNCIFGYHYNRGRKGSDCNACSINGKSCIGFSPKVAEIELPIKVGYKFVLKHSHVHGKVTNIDGKNVTIQLETGTSTTLSYGDLDKNSKPDDPITKYLIDTP